MAENVKDKYLDKAGATYLVGKMKTAARDDAKGIVEAATKDLEADVRTNKTDIAQLRTDLEDLDNRLNPLDFKVTVSPTAVLIGSSATINVTLEMKRGKDEVVTAQTAIVRTSPSAKTLAAGANKDTETIQPTAEDNWAFVYEGTFNGKSKTTSATVKAVHPSYFGAVAATGEVTAAMVKALGKLTLGSKAYTKSSFALSNQRSVFAYPASFGALTAITGNSNSDNMDSYAKQELTIDGVAYFVYVLKEPTTNSGLYQKFA